MVEFALDQHSRQQLCQPVGEGIDMSDVGSRMIGDQNANRAIIRRLEFYFAALTVLGGFVLAIGQDGAVIPVIAVFFGIVG